MQSLALKLDRPDSLMRSSGSHCGLRCVPRGVDVCRLKDVVRRGKKVGGEGTTHLETLVALNGEGACMLLMPFWGDG